MIGNFLRLSQEHLQQVLDDPEAVCELLFPEGEAELGGERHLQIGSAWHILHFLLTGTAWEGEGPEAKVILGGTPLGDEDIGYRPPQYLSVGEVCEVAVALSRINGEQLWTALDLEVMQDAGLYAFTPDRLEEKKIYALGYFERVKAFYRKAAEDGETVVKYLS
jgi:hypothetical protein